MDEELRQEIAKVFTEEQQDIVVQLFENFRTKLLEEAERQVGDRLGEHGVIEDEFFGTTEEIRHQRDTDTKVNQLKHIWDNQGVNPKTGREYKINDMIEYDIQQYKKLQDSQFSTDNPILIARVISEFVKEAIEPRLKLAPLLTKVQLKVGSHITFPAVGAIYAADIPELGEYPERELEFAGVVTATIGKVGVAVKFSEEMIQDSRWDIVKLHYDACGRALARHKEEKVATMITAAATTDFDNDGGTHTTGRGSDGAYNGTFTLDDLLTMYAAAVNEGYQPNTLLMNPMGWLIFARDPVMRAFGFANGGEMWQAFQGAPGGANQWRGGGFINEPWKADDPQYIASTYTPVPTQFPFSPIDIVVSPYVNYDATNNVTDIYLCDRSELGYLVEKESVYTEDWKDPARDIYKTKFRERYAVAGPVDDRIRVAKNVVISKGYDLDDNFYWQMGTGQFPTGDFDLGL